MRVVDSSAWIEWLKKSPAGRVVDAELPENANWLVPTIVQFELAKWATRELGPEEAEEVVAFSKVRRVIPLESNLAIYAAEISTEHKLAMADAIVYATAQQYDADVLTCDAHFETLPGVKFIDKRR
ncbi:MAG TPA: type II toxin-antitoxin system VapC family toxin [Caulobacterales bacterium]|nr:type II toxin-antitoxin system VapC family toxin [Caulobacterales bacterium]